MFKSAWERKLESDNKRLKARIKQLEATAMVVRCPGCNGIGAIGDMACEGCHGSGLKK